MVTYVDDTAQAATTYDYRVAAFNATGNSDYSNVVQVVVPSAPAAPTALTATVQAGPQVTPSLDRQCHQRDRIRRGAVHRWRDLRSDCHAGSSGRTGNTTYVDTTVQDGLTLHLPGGRHQRGGAVGLLEPGHRQHPANGSVQPDRAARSSTRYANIPQVLLQWADRSTNETGFVIERCTTVSSTNLTCVGAYALIATAPAGRHQHRGHRIHVHRR